MHTVWMETMDRKELVKKIVEARRVPQKYKGQDPKKHSDLYTDENPKGTIHGLGFKTGEDAARSIRKIQGSGRKHAHKVQAAIAMGQRAEVASKRAKDPAKRRNLAAAAGKYKTFLERMKKITKKRNK